MLSVKQDSIKYYFLSLWYDSTWDWTQLSRAISEHSNHYANVRYDILIIIVNKRLNNSIWCIEGVVKGNTTPGKSGHESNGNETGTLYYTNINNRASPSEAV